MKVILVNGSPDEKGCTYTALSEVAKTLDGEGVESEIFHIGKKPISGCTACGACGALGRCVIDDRVNEFSALAANADGFVFGSPVYYGSPNGALLAFMDRVFYSALGDATRYYLKPAAAVVSARRAGTVASFDVLNRYFTLMQMPVVSAQYWNMVYGAEPEEVAQDAEGLFTMRTLARNMAWLLKCKRAGENAGVPLPTREPGVFTNFIR